MKIWDTNMFEKKQWVEIRYSIKEFLDASRVHDFKENSEKRDGTLGWTMDICIVQLNFDYPSGTSTAS